MHNGIINIYDDCGLTLHFKVGTCGVPSIFELSTPACLACLSGQLELDNLQIEVSLSHEFAQSHGVLVFYLPLFYYNLNEFSKLECSFFWFVSYIQKFIIYETFLKYKINLFLGSTDPPVQHCIPLFSRFFVLFSIVILVLRMYTIEW